MKKVIAKFQWNTFDNPKIQEKDIQFEMKIDSITPKSEVEKNAYDVFKIGNPGHYVLLRLLDLRIM